MANHFVPLLAPPSSAPPVPRPGLMPVPTPGAAPAFAPIHSATPNPPTAPAPPAAAPCDAAKDPEVTLKREGDRITQIQIRCSCGESVILDCDYNSTPST